MKILFFYPENPLNASQGNNARALALLKYFRNRNFTLDYVGEESDVFLNKDLELLKKDGLINKGWLLKKSKRKGFKYFFTHSLPILLNKKIKQFDRTRPKQQEAFNQILKDNTYDFIIISYVYWMPLVIRNKLIKNTKVIIDTHDFLTAQFQNCKGFKLGKFFESEINLLSNAGIVFAISNEEKQLFSQFLENDVRLITHGLECRFNTNSIKEIDLFYIASDNPHNIKSAKWFFSEIYPLLNKEIKMCVVGKIINYIDDYKNVEKVYFTEDLNELYANSKVVVCPMLSGTGVKIKVVEALSFGVPIVCNERGVDGLLNKTNNGCLVTNNPEQFVNYINELLENEIFYNQIKTHAQSFFKEQFLIEKTYLELDTIFKRINNN